MCSGGICPCRANGVRDVTWPTAECFITAVWLRAERSACCMMAYRSADRSIHQRPWRDIDYYFARSEKEALACSYSDLQWIFGQAVPCLHPCYAYWCSNQSSTAQRTGSVALHFVKILLFHKRKLVNSTLMRIPCGRVSCDFAFDCIPVAHETVQCSPDFPSTCCNIHPALRNRRVWGRNYTIHCMSGNNWVKAESERSELPAFNNNY